MSVSSTSPPIDDARDRLCARLHALRHEMLELAAAEQDRLSTLPEPRRASAANMLHYLALRKHDLRSLQEELAPLGLSSIGRLEPHVLATVEALLTSLDPDFEPSAALSHQQGLDTLEENTTALLGERPGSRYSRIMVTLPAVSAEDYLLMHQLLKAGMNLVRINCSHDDPAAWRGMIRRLRDAERATGQPCRILMDLGGPKLRTGPMVLQPPVLKIRPRRDAYGRVMRPARICLTTRAGAGNEADAADACLEVNREWLAECRPGDKIMIRDARGSKRRWRVRETTPQVCWAEALKTTYIIGSTRLRLRGKRLETPVDNLPQRESRVTLQPNDVLMLSLDEAPGQPAVHDENGELLSPGRVSLPVPEVYQDVRPGDKVSFDDGRISGLVEKRDKQQLQLRITHTHREVEKLGGDKGVNFPKSTLSLPALGPKDRKDLEFVARNADLVGLSFANRPEDVRALRAELERLGRSEIGVILKIETREGFARLPELLLEAMKMPACGVMIARGDLAVECGFERLAEIQEEILWLGEAAHVPVIWATQVLEGLAKAGHASRAEITDAAASQSAECVMLNKGPHIVKAVSTLDDILRRMQGHHAKKRSLMRKLKLAQRFKPAEA